ncbi:carboxylate-amine ligase [Pedobacter sp. L105]|uniref:carboxylate-amine ligase n=1 Tax=Pedobacter sp. L105 TaxID=1641871 RepID=UPI00131B9EED|nr:carboxylate-amine ligase [Pedobacter sp. L105]
MNRFTLGIEEEYMVIDPVTRELTSHDQQIVEAAQKIYKDQVKAEMHQAVVEVGTSICKNTTQARKEISELRSTVHQLAGDLGFQIGAAGTHPFSRWEKQLITEHPRYNEIINEFQEAARSNLIFGLHVHVGFQSRELAIHIANQVRYFLPHVFALSTNSPFWEGRNTGYKSFRTKIFDKFPRTGIPDVFNSIEDYDNYIKLLIKTNSIDNAKKIWWDIRVHPFFETIEFRICDCPLLIDETMAFVALFQALCAKLYKLRLQNMSYINYSRALINENKWRAARYGIDGNLIDFGKEIEVSCRSLVLELLDFVDDVVDELGCREDLNYIHQILERGTGADQQLAVYAETGSFEAVVDFITSQTLIGAKR